MKSLFVLFVPVVMLCAADRPAGKAGTAPAVSEIPKGAREFEPGVFRHVDASGKTWFYRKTPFGIARWEDKPAADPKPVDPYANIKAFEAGDSVRFERPTPFGVAKWERKKSELDDVERAALERARAAR